MKKNLLHIFAYLLWLVNILACVAAMIQFLSAINVLWVSLKGDRYTLSFINQVVLLLSSSVTFVYVIFLEGYYQASLTPQSVAQSVSSNIQTLSGSGTLLQRFIITTAIPLLVFILSLAVAELALNHIFFS